MMKNKVLLVTLLSWAFSCANAAKKNKPKEIIIPQGNKVTVKEVTKEGHKSVQDTFLFYAEEGNLDAIRSVVNKTDVEDLPVCKALTIIAEKNHINILTFFLKEEEIRSEIDSEFNCESLTFYKALKKALKIAVEKGYFSFFKTLFLEYEGRNIIENKFIEKLLAKAADYGHEKIVLFLVEDYVADYEVIIEALGKAVDNNRIRIVEILLSEISDFDGTVFCDLSDFFEVAAKKGFKDIVISLYEYLLNHDEVNFDIMKNAFDEAVSNGRRDIVNVLINYVVGYLNQYIEDNEIVDEEADIAFIGDVFVEASKNGDKSNVCHLIEHIINLFDNYDVINKALVKAAENGCEDVVKCLIDRIKKFLEEEEEELSEEVSILDVLKIDEAFCKAAKKGKQNILKFLINFVLVHKGDKKLFDVLDINESFVVAAENGQLDVVIFFFKDKTTKKLIKRRYCVNRGLAWAASNGHENVVKYFLEDPTLQKIIIPGDGDSGVNSAVMWSAANGHQKVLECLLNNKIVQQLLEPGDKDCGGANGALYRCVVDKKHDIIITLITNKVSRNNITPSGVKNAYAEITGQGTSKGELEGLLLVIDKMIIAQGKWRSVEDLFRSAAKNRQLQTLLLLVNCDLFKREVAAEVIREVLVECDMNGLHDVVKNLMSHEYINRIINPEPEAVVTKPCVNSDTSKEKETGKKAVQKDVKQESEKKEIKKEKPQKNVEKETGTNTDKKVAEKDTEKKATKKISPPVASINIDKLIKDAARKGNFDAVKNLSIDPCLTTEGVEDALERAAYYCRNSIVRFLMMHKKVTSVGIGKALIRAIEKGHSNIAFTLLKSKKLTEKILAAAIDKASQDESLVKLVESLAQHKMMSAEGLGKAIFWTKVYNGWLDGAYPALLKRVKVGGFSVDLVKKYRDGCCDEAFIKIAEKLSPQFPPQNIDAAILFASKKGDFDAIDVLLRFMTPINSLDNSLIAAVQKDSGEIIELLLSHPKTKGLLSIDGFNGAIEEAAKRGRQDILEIILASEPVKGITDQVNSDCRCQGLFIGFNKGIAAASHNGNPEIVKYFIEHPVISNLIDRGEVSNSLVTECDYGYGFYGALEGAVLSKNKALVVYLIKNDATRDFIENMMETYQYDTEGDLEDSKVIDTMLLHANTEIMKFLVEDETTQKMITFDGVKGAFERAAEDGERDTIVYLLKKPFIREFFAYRCAYKCIDNVVQIAASNGFVDVLKAIVDDELTRGMLYPGAFIHGMYGAVQVAASCGHRNVLEFFVSNPVTRKLLDSECMISALSCVVASSTTQQYTIKKKTVDDIYSEIFEEIEIYIDKSKLSGLVYDGSMEAYRRNEKRRQALVGELFEKLDFEVDWCGDGTVSTICFQPSAAAIENMSYENELAKGLNAEKLDAALKTITVQDAIPYGSVNENKYEIISFFMNNSIARSFISDEDISKLIFDAQWDSDDRTMFVLNMFFMKNTSDVLKKLGCKRIKEAVRHAVVHGKTEIIEFLFRCDKEKKIFNQGYIEKILSYVVLKPRHAVQAKHNREILSEIAQAILNNQEFTLDLSDPHCSILLDFDGVNEKPENKKTKVFEAVRKHARATEDKKNISFKWDKILLELKKMGIRINMKKFEAAFKLIDNKKTVAINVYKDKIVEFLLTNPIFKKLISRKKVDELLGQIEKDKRLAKYELVKTLLKSFSN